MSRLRAVLGALAFPVLFSAPLSAPALAAPPASIPYTWKSVQIVGGGFVDGFVFHPTAKDVFYARTDIGRRLPPRSQDAAAGSPCSTGSPTRI